LEQSLHSAPAGLEDFQTILFTVPVPRSPEAGVALEGYDLVMLGILAAAALLGYFKGMVWQLAWIAGIAASSYAAFRFGAVLAPFFGTQAPWNRFAAMLAVYAGTSIAVWLVFRVISGAINAVHLSAFDHQLGLLLGLAKGVLLCVVVTFFSVTLAPAYRHQIVASRSGRLVAELIVRADTYLPKEIHETVDPFVKQFEQQFENPPGSPAAVVGQSPMIAGQQSPLKAMWEGVTSAAAWAGPEQGGAAGQGAMQAGGTLPAGSAWFVPRATGQAPEAPVQRYATPAAAGPAGGGFASPQRFAPQPAASPMPAQPFTTQPVAPQQPPPRYPVGAQSPLPGW
jgi:membrane protein required for colicin V production